jgi:hypothetical protein
MRWVDALRKEFAAIRKYDLSTLADRFGSGTEVFDQIADFCREVESLPFERLPAGELRHLLQPLKALTESLRQLSEFTPVGQMDPDETLEHLLRNTQNSYDHFFAAMAPYVAYLKLPNLATRAAADSPQDLRLEVRDGLRQLRKKIKELDKLADTLRAELANVDPSAAPKTITELNRVYTDKQATESVIGAVLFGLALAAVLLWFAWLATSWGV